MTLEGLNSLEFILVFVLVLNACLFFIFFHLLWAAQFLRCLSLEWPFFFFFKKAGSFIFWLVFFPLFFWLGGVDGVKPRPQRGLWDSPQKGNLCLPGINLEGGNLKACVCTSQANGLMTLGMATCLS